VRFGDDLDVSPWRLAAVLVIAVALWCVLIEFCLNLG